MVRSRQANVSPSSQYPYACSRSISVLPSRTTRSPSRNANGSAAQAKPETREQQRTRRNERIRQGLRSESNPRVIHARSRRRAARPVGFECVAAGSFSEFHRPSMVRRPKAKDAGPLARTGVFVCLTVVRVRRRLVVRGVLRIRSYQLVASRSPAGQRGSGRGRRAAQRRGSRAAAGEQRRSTRSCDRSDGAS